MLLHEQIKERFHSVLVFLRKKLHPESSSRVRKLQFFWLGCGGFLIILFAYAIVTFLFAKAPLPQQEDQTKEVPTSIETMTSKVDLNEVFRHRIEDELNRLFEEFTKLKTIVQNEFKIEGAESQEKTNEEDDSSTPELSKNRVIQELETKILNLERQVEEKTSNISNQNIPIQSQEEQGNETRNLIQKVSLSLSENPKLKSPHLMRPRTVDTTIPAGAFAKTVLLSGLDASSAMTASSDPRPMLLRLIDYGTLPRRFQSDLKDCHCTASAYGDLSSERVYARLEKLTCIERSTGEIIETQVAGYIAGSDGKAGIRGIVVSKDGQFLIRSLVGGMFAGLSNVANPQNRQNMVNPFAPGSAQVSAPNVGEMFTSGMSSGATSALDRLSQYYIDRAEQLQPVIQVAAGQVVDIVFTEGTFIGAHDVQSEIKNQRSETPNQKTE